MWMAKSEDGVHWESIGPVLEDTCGVCKMYIYEADDKVVINFGSFSDPGRCNNDTLRFYVSQDMVNWRFVGENHPDANGTKLQAVGIICMCIKKTMYITAILWLRLFLSFALPGVCAKAVTGTIGYAVLLL